MKRRYISILFLILIAAARLLTTDKAVNVMRNLFQEIDTEVKETKPSIVIDAGHCGRDPGKVGINGTLEKDINLSIALRLRDLLEQNDIRVIMTRTEDTGLYSEHDAN